MGSWSNRGLLSAISSSGWLDDFLLSLIQDSMITFSRVFSFVILTTLQNFGCAKQFYSRKVLLSYAEIVGCYLGFVILVLSVSKEISKDVEGRNQEKKSK